MAGVKNEREEVAEDAAGIDAEGESRPSKKARTELHADLQALVECICDDALLRKYVETSSFDERGLQLDKVTVFSIKQGLTWLRAIEQELLKLTPNPESLAQLTKSCVKALGFDGAGCQCIDSLDKMKEKALALESLVDIETVYARLLRIAAGGGGKSLRAAANESSDEEDEDGEEKEFGIGDKVQTHSLNAVAMNGKEGKVVGFRDDRVLVEFADKASAGLKPVNLKILEAAKKKRPTTAFFRFIAERREGLVAELQKELGTEKLKPTLVVKRASEIWKALPEAERAPYEDPYKAEKEVYDQEKADKRAKEDAEAWEVDPLCQRKYRMLGCNVAPISHGSPVWCMLAESILGTQSQEVAADAMFVGVEKMFSISRASEEKHYAKAPSQNRRLLWYSAPLACWAGLLSNGMRLPQPETPFSGYSFGKGVYFSDMVSAAAAKSGAGDGERAIVLLCEVALGKSVERHEAAKRGSSKLAPGHHSTIGRGLLAPSGLRVLPDGAHLPLGPVEEQCLPALAAGSARLPCNEYVIYNPAHIRMRYLFEVRIMSGAHQEDIAKVRDEMQSAADAQTTPLTAKRLCKKTSADTTLLAR